MGPFSAMRALLRPLAIHAAYSPIETIVFFSIVGTLAYFHVLTAIKHSAFFSGPSLTASLRPTTVSLQDGKWVASSWTKTDENRLELQQIVWNGDWTAVNVSKYSGCTEQPCFELEHEQKLVQTLVLSPNARDDFLAGLSAAFPVVEGGLKLELDDVRSTVAMESIGEMKSSKWVAYAARAFVLRFWDLAKVF